MKRMNYTIMAITLLASSIGLSLNLDIKPALAGGCNVFGCSESRVANCNPFGCPNAPIGQACTPFGCPESPQPVDPYPVQGSSPEAVSLCMNKLMYQDGVRTEVSDSSAAVACQNAR